MKRNTYFLTLFLCLLGLLLLIFLPDIALEGSKTGLMLWFQTLLPTLLPFLILTSLLRILCPNNRSLWLATALGVISGYPIGAKLVAESPSTHRKDFFFAAANNPSPMFILILVGKDTLSLGNARYLFFMLLMFSSIAASYIITQVCPTVRTSTKKATETTGSLMDRVDLALQSSLVTIGKIGGYVIIFSILGKYISYIFKAYPSLTILLSGCLELTGGIFLLSNYAFSSIKKIVLAAFLTGFGGFCAMAQTKSVTTGAGLSIKHYLLSKLLCGILASLLCFLFFNIF